jgi:hypothetical protein
MIYYVYSKDKKEVIQMYKIFMVVDGETYYYGADPDQRKANEIAMRVREERNVETYVEYDPD